MQMSKKTKKVSVIMPVYLGEYEGCATDRQSKFIRAVRSVFFNIYKNIELVIIGDCCEETSKQIESLKSIISEVEFSKIVFYNFPEKQKLFSGNLRSKGLELATGEIIMYLDSDDFYGINHIFDVVSQLRDNELDWAYFNDLIQSEQGAVVRDVELRHGSAGTSSIAHLRENCPNWTGCDDYGHDWLFILRLMEWSENYDKIYGCSYVVNHIPEMSDF